MFTARLVLIVGLSMSSLPAAAAEPRLALAWSDVPTPPPATAPPASPDVRPAERRHYLPWFWAALGVLAIGSVALGLAERAGPKPYPRPFLEFDLP